MQCLSFRKYVSLWQNIYFQSEKHLLYSVILFVLHRAELTQAEFTKADLTQGPTRLQAKLTRYHATSSHAYMTSFVNFCDVKSTDNRYVCYNVNYEKKIPFCCEMTSFHLIKAYRITCIWENSVPLKKNYSLEKINLSRRKQNYICYLFDKLRYFPVKHVIYTYNCPKTF